MDKKTSLNEHRARRAAEDFKRTGRRPTGLPWAVERRALVLAGAELFGLTPDDIEARLVAENRRRSSDPERPR